MLALLKYTDISIPVILIIGLALLDLVDLIHLGPLRGFGSHIIDKFIQMVKHCYID